MIEIELPDGTIAEFPDGTPDETISSVLSKQFGGAQPQTEKPAEESRGLFRRVDDFVRGGADMLTFGLADEFSAKMGDVTGIGGEAGAYDKNLAAQRQRDSQGGVERLAGQLAGAVAIPGAAARTVGGAALQGAAMGGAYGFGSGEGDATERAKSAALGAATGGAVGGAVRGVTNAIANRAARATIPTTEALKAAGNKAYKAAEDAGAIIKAGRTARLTQSVKDDLAEFGYDTALHPGVGAVLRRLEDLEGSNVTVKGLDIVRRVAANAAKDYNNPSQQALAAKVIDHIDDFMADIKPADILAGDGKKAANEFLKARSLWTRMKKAESVDTAALRAELRAAASGSGANADNALRQNVNRLLSSPKASRGMSKVEKKAAERVVRGTVGQNLLRLGGKAAPTGIVSGGGGAATGALIGSFLGGPAGAAVGAVALPAAGKVSQILGDRATARNAEALSEIIRSGGYTAKQLAEMARRGLIPAIQGVSKADVLDRAIRQPVALSASALAERARR
jgi:hypothetical protein